MFDGLARDGDLMRLDAVMAFSARCVRKIGRRAAGERSLKAILLLRPSLD
jgi:hypothetical protein